ncbi:hypothetical protein [Paraburkholderia eburnea]|nr:hypothetical protein [Paraburkholderia eburnea]
MSLANLFAPHNGSATRRIAEAIEELEYTPFAPIASEVRAYWEQEHSSARYGIVTNGRQSTIAMIYIEMHDGFSHEGWTEDLLTIFKSELPDYAAINLNFVTSWPKKERTTKPSLHRLHFSFRTPRATEIDSFSTERPFVTPVMALPAHVPFDTVFVDTTTPEKG